MIDLKLSKLLEENKGQKLHFLEFGNDFLDMIPKAQVTIAKLDFMKFKKFCASKEKMVST